jgi:hypothetical protein
MAKVPATSRGMRLMRQDWLTSLSTRAMSMFLSALSGNNNQGRWADGSHPWRRIKGPKSY